MMELVIKINCDNAAFYAPGGEHLPGAEVSRILGRLAADCVGSELPHHAILDFEGNTCGSVEVIEA